MEYIEPTTMECEEHSYQDYDIFIKDKMLTSWDFYSNDNSELLLDLRELKGWNDSTMVVLLDI